MHGESAQAFQPYRRSISFAIHILQVLLLVRSLIVVVASKIDVIKIDPTTPMTMRGEFDDAQSAF
jgi:hypothetical protein